MPKATLFIVGLLATASAVADRFGIVGDSLSLGTNADDRCSRTVECLDKLGEAPELSFAAGRASWSLFNRLREETPALTRVETAATNGAGWSDALAQAQSLTRFGDLRVVHVELGGNDVCAEVLTGIDEIRNHVDATLSHLTETRATSTVIVSEVPDVVRLRSVMGPEQHFLFETFQDLWDLDYSRLRQDALMEVCASVYGEDACAGSEMLRALTATSIRTALESRLLRGSNSRFPCHRLLASDASIRHLTNADVLVRRINALLAKKALEYDGRNGTRVRFANNVAERPYTTVEPSKLDGFHLGAEGHELFAELIWDGLKPEKGFVALLADTNGDRRPEYAVVTAAESGKVRSRVVDVDNGIISGERALPDASPPVMVAVVPRYPGVNGSLLALLDRASTPPRVDLWSPTSGFLLSSVSFQDLPAANGLAVLPDVNGNGFPELALLTTEGAKPSVHVRDAVTGSLIRRLRFPAWGLATGLVPAPDLNGNLSPEVGVIKRRESDGRVRVELSDAATGLRVKNVGFGRSLSPVDHEWIPDLNGDLVPELALLLLRESRGGHVVKVRNPISGARIHQFRLPAAFAASALAHARDQDGNGAAEFAILGVWEKSQGLRVRFYDTHTRRFGGGMGFGVDRTPLDLSVVESTGPAVQSKIVVLSRDRLEQLHVRGRGVTDRVQSLSSVIP